MGRNEKDQIAKIVCFGIGCLIAYYVLLALLPFIELFLALIGAAVIYCQYQKNNRR